MVHKQIVQTSKAVAIVRAGESDIAQIERLSFRGRMADKQMVATRLHLARCYKAVLTYRTKMRSDLDNETISPDTERAVDHYLRKLARQLRRLGLVARADILNFLMQPDKEV